MTLFGFGKKKEKEINAPVCTYIASLSMRKLCDERGNVYFGVDEDIRQRLQARLMRAILTFRVE